MTTERKPTRLAAGDRVQLRHDRLGLREGALGTVRWLKAVKTHGAVDSDASGRIVFVAFDGVFGTLTIAASSLKKADRAAAAAPADTLTLGRYPLKTVELACGKCGLRKRYRKATLVSAHGAKTTLAELRRRLAAHCPKLRDRSGKDACGAHFPDVVQGAKR